ncbi:hypothetical protein V8E36_009292 [Tilletia maclaganii]
MSDSGTIDPISPQLADALRVLERLPEEDRPAVEAAIRAQYDADVEAAEAAAMQRAQEDADRSREEQEEAEAEVVRQSVALKEQEAHIAAAKRLVDLVKSSELATESKDKGKKVSQDDSLAKNLDLFVAMPSQKVRERICANEYVDMWHLTPEGMAAATKSKFSGDTTFELGIDGSFKIKEAALGFKSDQDLSPSAWITATGNYVRVMQTEGVAANVVEGMIRLNHIMINHQDFERHGAAIRLWHQHQRRSWVISSNVSEDGQHFNLGKPNPRHFDELRLSVLE